MHFLVLLALLLAPLQDKPKKADRPVKSEPRASNDRTEVTYDRIHLRNGNVLDGHLIQQSEKGVLLGLTNGTVFLPREDVTRMERVTLRSVGEPTRVIPPMEVEAPKTPPPSYSPPPKARPTTPGSMQEPYLRPVRTSLPISAAEQTRITGLLRTLLAAPPEQREALQSELQSGGPSVLSFLADTLDQMNRALLDFMPPTLGKGDGDLDLPGLTRRHLASPRPEVRATVLQILSACKDADSRDSFQQLAQADPDPAVRRSAVEAMAAMADQYSLALFLELLHSEDPGIRNAATEGFSSLARKDDDSKEEAAQMLLEGFNGAAPGVQDKLLELLALLGNKEAVPDLTAMLESGDRDTRVRALSALGKLKASEALPIILEQLQEIGTQGDADLWYTVQLILAVQRIGDKRAVKTLLDVLETENDDIRNRCSQALKALTGQNFGSNPEKWREWYDKKTGNRDDSDEETPKEEPEEKPAPEEESP